MVKNGSLKKNGENVAFIVTDFAHEVPVTYTGILPDLFKEGKAWLRKASFPRQGDLPPPRSSQSTTRITCHRRRNTRLIKRLPQKAVKLTGQRPSLKGHPNDC